MNITDKIQITNEDNMALMARYPDKYFDLAIVDLEYGIGASKPSIKPNKVKQSNGKSLNIKQANYTPKEWDFKKSSPEYFSELFRVSKKQIIKGGNYYGLEGGYLVWNKLNGESDQFDCELFWLSFTQRTDNFYYMWAGMMQGIYCGKNLKKALVQQGDKSCLVGAFNHEDAALKFAADYNTSCDYCLMHETIEIKVEFKGKVKFFKVGAEPDVHYSSEEIKELSNN